MWIDTIENRTVFAVALAACVVLGVRKRVPPWAFAAVLVAGIVAVMLATPVVWKWGFHGQMHWAFSLASLRSSPPEDPTFAGQPLMYPWTAHWFYAHIGRALHVSPIAVLAASDVLWLAIMLLAAAKSAVILTGDRGAGLVAAFLAWTGVLITDDGYIQSLSHLHSAIRPCMRMVPADKFFNPNNNPIGLALSSLAMLCVVHIVVRARRVWVWTGLLFGAAFGCAALYPVSYVGLVVAIAGASFALAIVRRKLVHTGMLRCALAAALGGVAALPWMLAYDSGRGPDGQITATPAGDIVGKVAVLCAVAGPAIAILLAAGKGQWGEHRESAEPRDGRALLIGAALALGAAYLALFIPLGCEYKFLAQTAMPMACLLAAPIAGLARTKWWLAGLLLAMFSLGAADRELIRFSLDWRLPIHVEAGHARANDPERDAMLGFLRDRTPRDAVVLAEEPLVPVVGERSLYLLPRKLGTVAGDGWSMGTYKVTLAVVGHSREMLAQREGVQREVLVGSDIGAARAGAGSLRGEFPGRAVYAVVTSEGAQRNLEGSGAWRVVYRSAQWAVYEMSRP